MFYTVSIIFLLIKVFVTNKIIWKVFIMPMKSMLEVQTLDFQIELTLLSLDNFINQKRNSFLSNIFKSFDYSVGFFYFLTGIFLF